MVRPRLIVNLILKEGLIVRSQGFQTHQVIGSPIQTVRRLSNWNVDELVLLDISAGDFHDLRRDDQAIRYQGTSTIDLLRQISEVCFMPLAFGGRIRSIEDMHARLQAGADKIVINTAAVQNPDLIKEGAAAFGSQCVVVSIDSKRNADGRYEVYANGGRQPTGLTPGDWARRAEALGAGEIFLNSIDRDGAGSGYDLELIKSVTSQVRIPVIACGGVGRYQHFPAAILEAGADAAAAANIFHFYELAYPFAKKACIEAGLPMRETTLDNRWFPREPSYDHAEIKERMERRLGQARNGARPPAAAPARRKIRYCSRCAYPSISATPMEFDAEGVCMGCRMAESKVAIPPEEWDRRAGILRGLLEEARARHPDNPYDCVIPVSGGKDSYFQVHYMKNVLGAKPLLFTYYGNNFSEAGNRNLYRMKEAFDCDHIIYYPNVSLLKKLNRLGFIIMGDMNWHNHVGIATLVNQIAVQRQIPLVIWGEHGYADLSGQFSMNDFIEYTYRHRLEHFARGYEWNYFVGLEGITSADMTPYKQPSDREIFDLDLKGVYLANYVYWEANAHTRLVQSLYGWEAADQPFERTYRRISNVDDIYENGAHDYLKYIKFGYGRCTDHACKDIRAGMMSRGQAVDLVRKHDHVKSWDVGYWCDYVGMSMEEFDAIADTFRDPRVWRFENGTWVKDSLWD
jgi:imidazoleglycerol phosphate synthase cyclase subunit